MAVTLLLLMVGAAYPASVSMDRARRTASGWLAHGRPRLEKLLPDKIIGLRAFEGYFVVDLSPEGYLIVSAEDRVEPILAFSDQGSFDGTPGNPLYALLQADIPQRIEAVGKLTPVQIRPLHTKAVQPRFPAEPETKVPLQDQVNRANQRWNELESAGASQLVNTLSADGRDTLSDLRIPPLLQSQWGQTSAQETPCYNYFTPSGYPAGCLATALAQLLRFHQYPTNGIGQVSRTIYINGTPTMASTRGGDGSGGVYDWSKMPLMPQSAPYHASHWNMIGSLVYDCAVSLNMEFTHSESYANFNRWPEALRTLFGYTNSTGMDCNNVSSPYLQAIDSNLQAKLPVLLGIRSTDSGHAVVCDGYGYDAGTAYHHLNMGWSGNADAYYNLPNIDDYTAVRYVAYNVFPQARGEIIAGRVVDTEGAPVAGAQVSAQAQTGGATYTALSDDQGYYGLIGVPSSAYYDVKVMKEGYLTGISYLEYVGRSDTIHCGNLSNVLLTLESESLDVDLALASIQFSPVTIRAGEHPTSVSFELHNRGPGALRVPNTRLAFNLYVSPESTFSQDAIPIGSITADRSLGANAYAELDLGESSLSKLTIPETAEGLHYLFIEVSHEDPSRLSDATPANNHAVLPEQIYIHPKVDQIDVALSNFKLEPGIISPAAHPTTVEYRLTNHGPAPLESGTHTLIYHYTISPNDIVGDDDDRPLGKITSSSASLETGQFSDRYLSNITSLTIPDDAAGEYYVFVHVDHIRTDQAADPSPSNNVAVRSDRIYVPPPALQCDLSLTDLTFEPLELAVGAHPTSVLYRVHNQGPDDLASGDNALQYQWFLSSNQVAGDTDDVLFGDVSSSSATIPSGGSSYRNLGASLLDNLIIPAGAEGLYHLYQLVTTKAGSFSSDPIRTNNISWLDEQVYVPTTNQVADLAVSDVVFLPTLLDAGAHPTSVTFRVSNAGPQHIREPSNHLQYEIFLSRNLVLGDEDDESLAIFDSYPTLDAGQKSSRYLTANGLNKITIPAQAAGLYQVFIQGRHALNSAMQDTNRSNDYAVAPAPLDVIPSPLEADLAVRGLQFSPVNLAAGTAPTSVTFQVENLGPDIVQADAHPLVYRFTLSPNPILNDGDDIFLGSLRSSLSSLSASGLLNRELNETELASLTIPPVVGSGLHHVFVEVAHAGDSLLSDPVATNNHAVQAGLLSVLGGTPLADAVDAPTFTWETGGHSAWQVRSDITRDGVDAVRSGPCGNDETSWLRTTITGPGSIQFHWKVSSEALGDFLQCRIDDEVGARISGTVDWQAEALFIPAGEHIVSWEYRKNANEAEGKDTGWLDEIRFHPGHLVSIAFPAENDSFPAPATIPLIADILDEGWLVTQLVFHADGEVVGTHSVLPDQTTWTNVPTGRYTLSARAEGADGRLAASPPVHIETGMSAGHAPPTIFLLSPQGGTVMQLPTKVLLSAHAQDADGPVDRVEFWGNDVLLSTDSTPPYQYSWPIGTAGTYNVYAQAWDTHGLTSTSTVAQFRTLPPPLGLHTDGISPWFLQDSMFHDSPYAYQSGPVADLGYTRLETLLTGPGVLEFWWRVSSEQDFDILEYQLDDGTISSISGETDWERQQLFIPNGEHEVSWIYTKDSIISTLDDAGWVDAIDWRGPAADEDGDRIPDWQEFIAGTSIDDPGDGFRIHACRTSVQSTGIIVEWNSVPGKRYTVDQAIASNGPRIFSPVTETILATSTACRVSLDMPPDASQRWFRVRVERDSN